MMGQMNAMLMKMTHKMPNAHNTVTEHGDMKAKGSIIHEMAAVMNEIANSMDQGKMDQQTVDKTHDRIKSLQQKIEAVQK